MNAGDIYNEQMEQKAKALLTADFDELHTKFQSTIQFTQSKVGNGTIESFQHVEQLIVRGTKSIEFDKLNESIQKYYLTKAITA